MNTVNWEDQRAFLAVLEEGSLSAAARRLKVSQPTVRGRINALEHALNTVLFTRSPGGLVPTEQARSLLDAANAMSRASEAFKRTASAPANEIAGTVRLSVSEYVGVEVLPPMLAELRIAHPKIIIELVLSNNVADLLEQEVDVAVRMQEPRQAQLVAKKTGSIALSMFAHPDYLERRGTPTDIADLVSHDFIGPDRSQTDLEFAAEAFPTLQHERIVIRTDSHPAQMAATRAGLGIGIIQQPVGIKDDALLPVLPDFTLGWLDTWVVMHEDLRTLPRVRAVFDHLVTSFNKFTTRR